MDKEILTVEGYEPVVVTNILLLEGSYRDEKVDQATQILNHYIQLMSHDRNTNNEYYPPMIINIQRYSKEMLNVSKEVTFDDIVAILNRVWVMGINKLLVSSTYLREDDSTAIAEKLIFRSDGKDLTFYDIYTQSMLILSKPDLEVDSYHYRFTLSCDIPVLIMYTHG